MTKLTDFVEWKTVQGTAVSTPHHTLIPESQALTFKFPYGRIVWQRPTEKKKKNGNKTERYPVVDVTRLATWSILAASLMLPLLLHLIKKETA